MMMLDETCLDQLATRVNMLHRLDYNTFHYDYEGAIQPIRIRGEAYHTITIELLTYCTTYSYPSYSIQPKHSGPLFKCGVLKIYHYPDAGLPQRPN